MIAPGLPGIYPNIDFNTTSEVPKTDGPGQDTAAVTVIAPTPADDNAFAAASIHNLPRCHPTVVAGTVHIATIKATGVSWAIAGIIGDGCAGTWFYDETPPPAVGVFERQPGAQWLFNNEVGKPFPCPLPEGYHTGGDSSYVPAEVLQAWQMPYYSPNCLPVVPDVGAR